MTGRSSEGKDESSGVASGTEVHVVAVKCQERSPDYLLLD